MYARFGFEVVEGPAAVEWQRRVFDALGADPEIVRSRLVLENDVAVFVDYRYIGCRGHLLRKADGEILRFGSYTSACVHLWGFMQGIDMGRERSNTLVMSELRDADETLERLRHGFHARTVRNEILPALERGESVRLEGVDLYFLMRDLYEVERSGAFRFEVQP